MCYATCVLLAPSLCFVLVQSRALTCALSPRTPSPHIWRVCVSLHTPVNVKMTLPPPLSFLPSFLLNQAGGLVLKAVCATILPRFGQLVAEDYRRWSRGEPRVLAHTSPTRLSCTRTNLSHPPSCTLLPDSGAVLGHCLASSLRCLSWHTHTHTHCAVCLGPCALRHSVSRSFSLGGCEGCVACLIVYWLGMVRAG